MFMWLIKQLLNIRKVLDGRRHPHQLAWGLALGFLVGVVPHGNLLAIALIILVLSLRVNHSLAALTGVTVALLSAKLDPLTHDIGRFILTDPRWHDSLMIAWEWPLMPWTDLNNTVVAGSFTLGVAMVLPLYAISYPFFRHLQPAGEDHPSVDEKVVFAPVESTSERVEAIVEWSVIDDVETAPGDEDASGDVPSTAAEAPLDVVHFEQDENEQADPRTDPDALNEVPMNQALGYLLRRLRDSQQGDAA